MYVFGARMLEMCPVAERSTAMPDDGKFPHDLHPPRLKPTAGALSPEVSMFA